MTASLVPPSLPDQDPRKTVYGLLHACGLSVLLTSPYRVEHVLLEAISRAPVLASSSTVGGGFMRLDADPETYWVAVESPAGSAVIVFASPQSDSMLLTRGITIPFESSPSPFAREMVFQAETEPSVVALLTDYEVAPVTEFEPFSHIAQTEGHLNMPITVRRAARHWDRLTANDYIASFESAATGETEMVKVLLTLEAGRPELWTMINEQGHVPAWAQPMVDAGTHRIDAIDEQIFLITRLSAVEDSDALDAAARRLVADAFAAYATATRSAVPAMTSESRLTDLWARIDRISQAQPVGRKWDTPESMPEFGFIERVRESVSGDSSFESVDQLARMLRQHRGTGFEYAWRGDGDQLLSPDWLTVRSAVVDVDSGHVVVAGHLSHSMWNLPPAHDLGGIDGRNRITFPEHGHEGGLLYPTFGVYVGSLRSGSLLPLDLTLNVIAVDLDARTGLIAVLHHLGGSTGAVTVISPTQDRRLLTVLEGISGTESISFSADGSMLLVSSSNKAFVVDPENGQWIDLGVANVGWWPEASSTLVSIHHADGRAFPTLYDLSTNAYTRSFPVIELDSPLLETFPYVWMPDVSAGASEVLAATPAGVTTDYQQTHGTGAHLIRFNLTTGRGALVSSPFLDSDHTLERDVSEVRWAKRVKNEAAVVLHPDLVAGMREPVTTHDWLNQGRWADEAEQVLVLSLNVGIDATREGHSFTQVLPEILASLVPVASDPEVWERQKEWLLGLRDITVNNIAQGQLTGDLAVCWQRFNSAIAAIEAGRPDTIDAIGG